MVRLPSDVFIKQLTSRHLIEDLLPAYKDTLVNVETGFEGSNSSALISVLVNLLNLCIRNKFESNSATRDAAYT
jgi:hypothetical protein